MCIGVVGGFGGDVGVDGVSCSRLGGGGGGAARELGLEEGIVGGEVGHCGFDSDGFVDGSTVDKSRRETGRCPWYVEVKANKSELIVNREEIVREHDVLVERTNSERRKVTIVVDYLTTSTTNGERKKECRGSKEPLHKSPLRREGDSVVVTPLLSTTPPQHDQPTHHHVRRSHPPHIQPNPSSLPPSTR